MKKIFAALLFMLLAIPASAQEGSPVFGDLLAGEWEQIPVEGAQCLYGDDYSFFVRPADEPTDKLMIYFQGGGACWDALTCSSIGQFASQYDVAPMEAAAYTQGYFDFDNEDNPVSDYNVVFLPYCTGDLYTGDAVVEYEVPQGIEPPAGVELEETITVNFKGFENSARVLDWVYENIPTPEQVFVTGCSAGGYGATTHAPFIMNNYAGVPVVHMADSATGVNELDWEGLLTWNIYPNLPGFVEGVQVEHGEFSANLQFITTAAAFPDNVMAQYNTFFDGVQVGFYSLTALGEPVTEDSFQEVAGQWTPAMLTNIATIEAMVDNFASYTAGGSEHCIVNQDIFYEYDVAGVVFSDWVAALLAGSTDDVSCDVEGDECFVAPVESE